MRMKRKVALFSTVFLCILAGIAYAESLLQPASFPKTINDTSFMDRMELLWDGYDDYATIFDENGVCISGCAYKGITLESMIEESERATQEAATRLELYKLQHPEEFQDEQEPDDDEENPPEQNPGNDGNNGTTTPPSNPPSPPPSTPPSTPPTDNNEYTCPTNQWSKYIPKGRKVVDNAPLDTDLIVVSDIGPRNVSNGSSWHQGLDLRATDGTSIYLPANGIVTDVTGGPSSSAGYYIWVYHPTEQIYTRYLHLSKQLVKKGDKILGGCLIAKSGHSGKGRAGKPYAPHLHYEIKKTKTNNRGDVIDPFGNGINRLGRPYKFKNRNTPSPNRHGHLPTGCAGFL